MVKIVDSRGRGVDISLWGSVLPSHNRPAVRAIPARVPSAASSSKPLSDAASDHHSKKPDRKAKDATSSAANEEAEILARMQRRAPRAAPELGRWTADEDGLLVKLRDVQKKKWTDIVMLMERSQRLLVQRYEELKAAQQLPVSPIVRLTASHPEMIPTTGAGVRELEELDDDSWSATDPTDYITDGHANIPVLAIEGQELNLREMHMIVRLNDCLEDQKWILLASKIFDKTGKRVSGEALKAAMAAQE